MSLRPVLTHADAARAKNDLSILETATEDQLRQFAKLYAGPLGSLVFTMLIAHAPCLDKVSTLATVEAGWHELLKDLTIAESTIKRLRTRYEEDQETKRKVRAELARARKINQNLRKRLRRCNGQCNPQAYIYAGGGGTASAEAGGMDPRTRSARAVLQDRVL